MNKLLIEYNNLINSNTNSNTNSITRYKIYLGKKLFDDCFYTNINKRCFEVCFQNIKDKNDYNKIKYEVYTKYIHNNKELIVLRDGSNYCLKINKDLNSIANNHAYFNLKDKIRIKNDEFPIKFEYDNTILIETISLEYNKYNINFSINYDDKFVNEISIEIKDKDINSIEIINIVNEINDIIVNY